MVMEKVLLTPGRVEGRDPDESDSEVEFKRYRDKEGSFSEEYTDSAFLDAVVQHFPVATSKEIADAVGCSKRTALHRLDKLEEDDAVASKLVGRTRIWYLPENHD